MTEPSTGLAPAARTPGARRFRRPILALIIVAGVVAFTVVWALPNVAGSTFVQVRAVVTARAAGSGPTVVIAGDPAVQASGVDISVEVDNRYPLSVVLGTSPTAFRAAAYLRDDTGKLTLAWQTGVGDPTAEEGSDSPVGGGPTDGAVVVPTGVTRHVITDGSQSFSLVDATGAPMSAGVYYLKVWAYGIGSPLVPMALSGGTDPLGPPADLPPPPG
jgi:hypothetical protein